MMPDIRVCEVPQPMATGYTEPQLVGPGHQAEPGQLLLVAATQPNSTH